MKYFLLFVLLATLVSLPLFARDVEVIIIDTDLELPLEGVLIRSWDENRYISDKDGKIIINVPENRQVMIQASYPGYITERFQITRDTDQFIFKMRLSDKLQNQELIIEASRPGENETRTGRSIAISGQDLAQTAKIGAFEDTMASIKLLPGIIATEHFDASPSVRGGDPQDVNASLDGFYISSPYFWGGAFSIFDPRMIESAQLSHGVFSVRYGHTVSGLLDLTTKKPSSSENEIEIGTDASALRFNISVPLEGKGGILFMGRTTFLMPIFVLSKEIVKAPEVDDELARLVNSINRSPYIRSGTVTGNYNFTDSLELKATAFFGIDGSGIKYVNNTPVDGFESYEKLVLDYSHYQGFLTGSLFWNPRNDMLFKFTTGTGIKNNLLEEETLYNIYDKSFSQNFRNNYEPLSDMGLVDFNQNYLLEERTIISNSQLIYNIQGRIDFDWQISSGFLFAAGVQEMLKQHITTDTQNARTEIWLKESDNKEAIFNSMGIDPDNPNRSFLEDNLVVSTPSYYNNNIHGNILFNTSSYSLIEYTSPFGRFGSELGIRADHYYILGEDTAARIQPALNPRLNLDFNLLKDQFIFDSINFTVGTGLFSSMPDAVLAINDQSAMNEIKPTRSWTSVIGTKINFPYDMLINIEGYYKYIYDRMYAPLSYDLYGNMDLKHYFNGEGRVWGMDFILQRTRSRYWDGWISYSYNWTQHRDPSVQTDEYFSNEWYFPYYHRFHSLNLVLNVKPAKHINFYTRFGIASGAQLMKRIGTEPENYPVYIYDPKTDSGYFIEKYFWPEIQDTNNRTTPSLQLDMKISFFKVNKAGKTRLETYFAAENILSLLYFSKGNAVFNPYTGKVATGRTSASYGLPFPIPSFGINYYY